MDGSLKQGSLELLRSHLDDLALLEELTLDDCNEANAIVLRFLRDATIKLPRLRSLYLGNWTADEDLEAQEAASNACVEYVKTNPHLRKLEVFQLMKPFPTHRNELSFFLRLNRFGRLHLHPSLEVPLALWPKILAGMTGSFEDCGALQYFLRHKPALVRARNGSGIKRFSRGGE